MLGDLDIVRKRWPDAGAFYSERDHRTELEVVDLGRYVHAPIEIHIEPWLATEITIQRMALLAANLTVRWARNVRVLVPEVELASPLQIHGDRGLKERILREMRGADPFGNFEVGALRSSDPGCIRLRIGLDSKTTFPATDSDYWIDSAQWTAIGRRGKSCGRVEIRNVAAPTAALAAAIGAADLFKRAIGHRQEDWIGKIDWCTWDHTLDHLGDGHAGMSAAPDVADVGDLLIAGVGAVGSALLYILSSMRCQGRITLLDRDGVETSNINRSPLFTALDVCLSRRKIDVGKALLQLLGCGARGLQGSWHELSEKLSREQFDVWVSLTNEGGAWAEVPFQLPPVVLHGTTTSGWGFGFGRHIPRLEDCTACRLPRPHAEFRGPCAEGEVGSVTEQEPARASLPFLSAASAALVATELLKLKYSSVGSLPNAVCADLRSGLPAVVAGRFGPTRACPGCEIAESLLWDERGGRGRYASLYAHLAGAT